ncbi:Stress-antifung domain-containing protein [Cephalotus follicularis]|uniref:Stress-antifung domain-containing protein n=1 Tax=Cephalotus follicularis TaxID=3775 RepID=A0A1Q3CIL9_CEPFO|nr:Stress-antifung domain-containing protein [Cephalotus follicularis]
MSSTSSFYLLAFALLLQSVSVVHPLFHFCSNTGNFTANGPYETNLSKLFGYLSHQPPPSGFGVGSLGQNCKACIVDAGAEIIKRCPYNKGAVIWYDNCLLKYSNMEFFGQIDYQNRFSTRMPPAHCCETFKI